LSDLLLKKRIEVQRELKERAVEYSTLLQDSLNIYCAVLVGSVARGDFNFWSDIDVIIISDELPEHPLERSQFLYSYCLEGIEPKGYKAHEFIQMFRKRNPIAVEAIKDGLLLVDKGGVWDKVKLVISED